MNSWLKRLFEPNTGKQETPAPEAPAAKPEEAKAEPRPPYLTETVVFGMHRYRSANEDSTVYFVDEARGIRKKLIDREGRILDFPGIVEEDFWKQEVPARSLQPQIRFRTSFEKRDGRWILLWQIWPDGMYWMDDDGYGMTPDEEVTLYTFLDADGNYTGPFRIYRMGSRRFYPPVTE